MNLKTSPYCKMRVQTAAYVCGELTAEARQAFEHHCSQCAYCASVRNETRQTLSILRTTPPVCLKRDLAPDILARINREIAPPLTGDRPSPLAWVEKTLRQRHKRIRLHPSLPTTAALRGDQARTPDVSSREHVLVMRGNANAAARSWLRAVAAAAALLLLIGLGIAANSRRRPACSALESGLARTATPTTNQSPRAAAVEWLCSAQLPDGSWPSGIPGVEGHFGVAVSSLAMLAILDTHPLNADALVSVHRAATYLISQQRKDGAFGSNPSRDAYNHSMATLALLRARVQLDVELDKPLDAAISLLLARQSAAGGWGYTVNGGQSPNLSVTVWHIEALRQAALQERWAYVAPHLKRATRWVAAVADDSGRFGYQQAGTLKPEAQALCAMGAMVLMATDDNPLRPEQQNAIRSRLQRLVEKPLNRPDYYRDFFVANALKRLSAGPVDRALETLRERLMSRCAVGNGGEGIWPADDRWGRIGGPVYTTAMAAMTL